MSNTQSSKGNPAMHRIGNAHRKTSRQACWRNSEQRKNKRIEVQHQQEIANRALRKAGGMTPWQQVRAARTSRREEAGMREIWLRSCKEEQLPAS